MDSKEQIFISKMLLAWQGQLSFNELIEYSTLLDSQKSSILAAMLYQIWLARNKTNFNHFAYFNLGATLDHAGDLVAAKEAYLNAIGLAPNFMQPHFNLGSIYERLHQLDAAIAEWRWIEANAQVAVNDQKSLLLLALNNLGRVFEINGEYAQALTTLTKSLNIEPNQPDVLHHWVFLRAKQCEWPVYTPIDGISLKTMRQHTSALAMISRSDDPETQLAAAINHVKRKINSDVVKLTPTQAYKHKKIRIAYLSSDFCMHPVAMLTAELFELHDRENFEVYAYCWTNQGNSAIRQRVIKAMDHFEFILNTSDEDAAKLIRSHEIDILVDLHGQTLGARPNLLAYRPAPIQITYLGLPATTGLPSIDYVIADKFLIPEEYAKFYSEKPLYMPDVYQVSDRKRICGATPTRASCNLPEDAFVFCSFNNNYKFTPEIFNAWMNILRRVPNSVLWLLSDNPWAEANLRKEAVNSGIDASRLIFASRVLPEDYLARFAVPDLFLDTFPFNAGTTANDALWMGLPLLTYTGRSFASRMAGALLTAAKLEELITYNLQDYEEKAVALANAPEECQRIRQHLKQVKENGVLFNTPLFVRNLEAKLKQLVDAL